MTLPKLVRQKISLERLRFLIDPGKVFYRPVVFDILERGVHAELQSLLAGAKELKAEFGDLDGVIKAAETAMQKAGKT